MLSHDLLGANRNTLRVAAFVEGVITLRFRRSEGRRGQQEKGRMLSKEVPHFKYFRLWVRFCERMCTNTSSACAQPKSPFRRKERHVCFCLYGWGDGVAVQAVCGEGQGVRDEGRTLYDNACDVVRWKCGGTGETPFPTSLSPFSVIFLVAEALCLAPLLLVTPFCILHY